MQLLAEEPVILVTLCWLLSLDFPEGVSVYANEYGWYQIQSQDYSPNQILSLSASKEDLKTMIGYNLRGTAKKKRKALDNDALIAVDKAWWILNQIWRSLLPQRGWKLFAYLAKLKLVDSDFSYWVSYNLTSNAPTGVVWCSVSMNEYFQQFGDILFSDILKRQLNDMYWKLQRSIGVGQRSWIGVAILEAMRDSQILVLNVMVEMYTGISKNSVKVVFGGNILNAKIIEKICLLLVHGQWSVVSFESNMANCWQVENTFIWGITDKI